MNSRDYDDSGLVFFLNHYLTVKCNGCDTISFCHVSKCSEDEDHDEQGRPYLVPQYKHYPETFPDTPPFETFIEKGRAGEIASLSSGQYDTALLVQMLGELDSAYRTSSFVSCILLIRAIMDHVPPIFGYQTFAAVASSYGSGGRSFKELMSNLESAARKIADANLHLPIRKKVSVPTKTQVEFRAAVDALIAEIIRILSQR